MDAVIALHCIACGVILYEVRNAYSEEDSDDALTEITNEFDGDERRSDLPDDQEVEIITEITSEVTDESIPEVATESKEEIPPENIQKV